MEALMRPLGALVFASTLIGCGVPVEEDAEIESIEDGKYEAWDYANNPAKVGENFIYDVAKLPLRGATKTVPIAGDYWATANDSVNYRWDGDSSMSPAEKVEKAFNLPGFAKHVTDNYGIYAGSRKACNTGSDCSDQKDGSDCVKPRGATGDKAGRCVPGWWGICHGWSPYAITEPPAKHEVTKNGVTFYPGDLTALMSLIYSEDLPTKFLSSRCDNDKKDLGTDNMGRLRDGDCRDMNAGSLHVILTNFLGLQQRGFVEDRTFDLEVWNQPVQGFEVTNAQDGKLKEITKAQAISLLGLGFNFTAALAPKDLAAKAEQKGAYKATVAGEITFRTDATDGDVDLYIKKNGAVSASASDCSGTTGSAKEECKVTVAVGDTVNWLVLAYSASKQTSLQVGVPGSTASYTYNTTAARFFQVEADVHYISEAAPGHSQPDPSSYIRTDHYSYILEADADGRLLGGEYLGESRMAHPDFAWWPSSKPTSNIKGLTYAMLKELNDAAADVGLPGGGGAPQTETKKVFDNEKVIYSAYSATWSRPLGVPAGVKKLSIKMSGTGNADLYIRVGAAPTTTSYLKKSTGGAADGKTFEIDVPASGANYFVRVRIPTKTGNATVTVTATLTR
jgi:hypothetical protein